MRPTPLVIEMDNDTKVLMLGGRSDRSSQLWSTKQGAWTMSPKLPVSHSLTSFVGVNYRNESVFTFCQDSQMTISSAFLDLRDASSWTSQGTDESMEWAL